MLELAIQQSQNIKSQVIRPAEHERRKTSTAYSQNPIMVQQQAFGNQSVQRMLQAKRFQAKVVVNPPNDEYEKEADQVADTVMRMPEPRVGMPPSEPEKEDEEKRLQTKPLPGHNLHLIQRDETEKEEDVEKKPLQTKPISGQYALIQREEVSEDKEKKKKDEEMRIQTKSISGQSLSLIQGAEEAGTEEERKRKDEEGKHLQTKPLPDQNLRIIQRDAESEDEEKKKKDEEKQIQTKSLSGQSAFLIQRAEEAGTEDERKRKDEEEKHLQTKSLSGETPSILDEARDEKRKARSENEEMGIISRKIASDKVGITIEEHLLQNQGQGQLLDTETRNFFEPRFGHDFGKVRLHTGARAKETAMSLSARAFTFGENIAFGEGQYAPASKEGRLLLAHELTHVLQQSSLSSQNTMQQNARDLDKDKYRFNSLQPWAGRPLANRDTAGKLTSVAYAPLFPVHNIGVALSIGSRNFSSTPMVIQRNFLTDLWHGLTEIGPAVMRAVRLVATLITNPGKLPFVLASIAWEEIPDRFKGPIIDMVLQACLTLARAMVVPTPILMIGAILKNAAIGFLERALSYPTGMKVRVANRMAKMVTSPSMDFTIGYLIGLLKGLWDGITGPFVLLWDIIKIGYQIVSAQLRFISSMFNRQARESLGRDIQAALERISGSLAQVVAQLMSGRSNPLAILSLIGQLIDRVLRQVQSLGASMADALLRFMNKTDRALGESLGWLAGVVTFEVLLLVLTEGGYTAIKESIQGLKLVVRLIEMGGRAWEALGPVRAALTGFRTFAQSNRVLAPLLRAVEEVFALLFRFLRFSYGAGGPSGAAARRGERATLEVANTATHETHRLAYLAEGRIIRCSGGCMELTANIIERARQLQRYRMPGESSRLVGEAEQIANECRALENSALSEAEKATQRRALLRRAGSLERQTAAAEILIPERIADPARLAYLRCQAIFDRNPGNQLLSHFEGNIGRLKNEIKDNVPLLYDVEMRPLAENYMRELEQQAIDLENQMRRLVPETAPAPPVTAPVAPFDVRAFEASLVGLPPGERVAIITPQARIRAASRGLERDRRLSALNNRDVYVDPNTGHLYSVDTQHGRFEHCNPAGHHIEEVNFNFEWTGGYQDHHNLHVD